MSDHHVPRYHIRPPVGYVNDPNGPVYFGDRWHLFFQYVHDTPRRGAVVWGHASSEDLAVWQVHRPAISPDPSGPDRNGCWSGNTVVVGNELVAFYSGSRSGAPYQSVVSARSVDGGFSFGPATQVVDDPAPGEQIDEFRDPFVWREDGGWSMLVGAGSKTVGPSARFYRSGDLRRWEYQGSYAAMPSSPEVGDVWECPQLLTFGEREVLLVSSYRFEGGHTPVVLALTGARVQGELKLEGIARLDHGPNFYAASVQRDGGLLWGWITEGRDRDWTIEADWSGLISLPRTTHLTDDGRLATYPAESLLRLRGPELQPLHHPNPTPTENDPRSDLNPSDARSTPTEGDSRSPVTRADARSTSAVDDSRSPVTEADARPPVTEADALPTLTVDDALPPLTVDDALPPLTVDDALPPLTVDDARPPVTVEDSRSTVAVGDSGSTSAGVAPASVSFEVPAQFEVEATLSRGAGLSLRCSEDEHLDLTVDWDTGAVTIDRTHASRDPRAHRDTHTFTDSEILATGTLTLRWFVDGSVTELFTTTGHSATTRFYPTTPPPWTLTATGPTTIRIWSLTW